MRLVLVLWLAGLLAVSLAPDNVKFHLGTKGSFHYAAHFIALAITGALFSWQAFRMKAKLACTLAACLVAVLLEAAEAFVYRNPVEWRDVAVGCFGAAFGLAVAIIIQSATANRSFVRK